MSRVKLTCLQGANKKRKMANVGSRGPGPRRAKTRTILVSQAHPRYLQIVYITQPITVRPVSHEHPRRAIHSSRRPKHRRGKQLPQTLPPRFTTPGCSMLSTSTRAKSHMTMDTPSHYNRSTPTDSQDSHKSFARSIQALKYFVLVPWTSLVKASTSLNVRKKLAARGSQTSCNERIVESVDHLPSTRCNRNRCPEGFTFVADVKH